MKLVETLRSRVRFVSASLSAFALASAAIVAASGGCAKSDESGGFENLDPTKPEAGEQVTFSEAGSGPWPELPECADETKQIYVVATDKALYRFYPDKLEFVRIGSLGCPSAAGTFSMAIDRRGTAWVEFTDGRLFAVNTVNGTCRPTAFQPAQTGFETFGMGFARNGEPPIDAGSDASDEPSDVDSGSQGETLYASGAGLAAIDTTTFELSFLGSLSFGRTELTARGTELFAFSVGSGVIAGLDKKTAATKVVYRTSAINQTAAFAFAHWGGDFYIFTGNTTSEVTTYSPDTDTSKVVIANTGMLIVGAGSSTCAPTTRPR